MTREYVMKRLLEHGPLTIAELLEITGWQRRAVWAALDGIGAKAKNVNGKRCYVGRV